MGALLDNPGCQGATRPVSTASLRTHGGVPCGPQIKVDSGQASANGNIEFLLAENGHPTTGLMLGNTKSEGQKVTIFNSGQAISGVTRPFYRRRTADCAFANPPYAVRGERTGASARASAAAAPMASLDRPAAEPWLAVVVQVAAARKVQRLAAAWELLRLAGGNGGHAVASGLPLSTTLMASTFVVWSPTLLRAQRRGHRNLKYNLIVSADC
jgi:hypothetical protein